MRTSCLATIFLITAAPVGAVTSTYTYTYNGPDLVCDEGWGSCDYGATKPALTGSFVVDPTHPDFGGGDITFSVFYVDRYKTFGEEILFKDTGQTRASDTCDGVKPDEDNPCVSYSLPEFIVDAGILEFFSTPAWEETMVVDLDFTSGELTDWYLESSTDGCPSLGYADVIRSAEVGCSSSGYDLYSDFYKLYAAEAPGSWTRTDTPAPIPLPAGAWLLLSAIGAAGAVRRRWSLHEISGAAHR